MFKYLIVFIILFALEILYIKIAKAKNIKDTPNHRSAHTKPTIRGGGIIILFAVLMYPIIYVPDLEFYYLLSGVVLVSVISFLDDILTLSSKIRILIHLIAFTLIFYSLGLMQFNGITSIALLSFIYIFSIGYLNIYNFMDGVNGITFLNALVSYGVLLYLNNYYVAFEDSDLLIVLMIAVLVFGFFNFRKKALCFAGDVGSIAIGFSLIYFAIKLYLASNNLLIMLIFSVYLLDGGWTIFERLLDKENVFEAHKRHLYQKLANDLKWPHLKVSTFYFLFQILINIVLIFLLTYKINGIIGFGLVFIVLSILYFLIKKATNKKINRNV